MSLNDMSLNDMSLSETTTAGMWAGSTYRMALLAMAAVLATYVGPACAVEASGTATIQCGAFSGAPEDNPAWSRSVAYSIRGRRVSLTAPVRQETNQWRGTIDEAGQILLTGQGSGGGGAWVMRFTGTWQGAGSTQLAGGYKNVRGLVGGRSCNISL